MLSVSFTQPSVSSISNPIPVRVTGHNHHSEDQFPNTRVHLDQKLMRDEMLTSSQSHQILRIICTPHATRQDMVSLGVTLEGSSDSTIDQEGVVSSVIHARDGITMKTGAARAPGKLA